MKDMILIRENEEMAGVFSDKTLVYKNPEGFSVSAGTAARLEMDFPFKSINAFDSIDFNWKLDLKQAIKGFVLGGAEVVGGKVVVVLTNASGNEKLIKEGEPVVSVSFSRKSMVKAIPASKHSDVVFFE